MSEAPKLLPCPHCGGGRITVWNVRDGQQAVCKDCKATGGPEYHGPADIPSAHDRAIAAWNRRASLKASQEAEVVKWRKIADDEPPPPHGVPVLLWSPPSMGHPEGLIEARPYSTGRSGPGWSEVSQHSYATYWMPQPTAPLATPQPSPDAEVKP